MTLFKRLLPPLLFSILVGNFALLSSCSDQISTVFCDGETPCDSNEVCNTESKACEAIVNTEADAGEISPDAMLSVCEGGNECVPSIPSNWMGPLVYTTADSEQNLASCPGAYAEEVAVLGREVAATFDCECSCGIVENRQCSDAVVYPDNGNAQQCGNTSCQGGVCPNEINVPAQGSAVATSHAGSQVATRLGRVTAGTCSAPSVDSEFTTGFASISRLCQSDSLSARCEDGQICAPTIPTNFEQQRCIAREGEFECVDTGTFTEQTLLYTNVEDNRECDGSSCDCSTENQSCRGNLELRILNLGGNVVVAGSTPGCFDVPETGIMSYFHTPAQATDCRLNGAAVVTGNATATGATTLCCEPEL